MLKILHYLQRKGRARLNVLGFVCLMVLSVVGSTYSMSVQTSQMNPISDHVKMMKSMDAGSDLVSGCHDKVGADHKKSADMDCSTVHCNHIAYMNDYDHLFVSLKDHGLFDQPDASPSERTSALFIPPRRNLV